MSSPSFKDQFLSRFTRSVNESKDRSRQFLQQLWQNNSHLSSHEIENTPLIFLEEYECSLFPEQTVLKPIEENRLHPFKVRTAELILKEINIYYLPYRLESLLPYCDPFTAVGTFLSAFNLSYQSLIQDQDKQKLAQGIINELMTLEKDYDLKRYPINEFPLYEAGATHDLSQFQKTAFACKRALDIIHILEQVQPKNYEKQKNDLFQSWHRYKIQKLEKIIAQLNQ